MGTSMQTTRKLTATLKMSSQPTSIPQRMSRTLPAMVSQRTTALISSALLLTATSISPALAAEKCVFLQPIGGDGASPVAAKSVGPGKLLGKPNWNTDFVVDRPFRSYKFFFTANSSDSKAKYPVEGFMKFTDGSSLKVINETMNPPIGTGRMFGPFQAVPGKQAKEMNFKVGASSDPGALGFSYRVSVQGCD
jgi:hypothetical protein